jgi:hypothetical protein
MLELVLSLTAELVVVDDSSNNGDFIKGEDFSLAEK